MFWIACRLWWTTRWTVRQIQRKSYSKSHKWNCLQKWVWRLWWANPSFIFCLNIFFNFVAINSDQAKLVLLQIPTQNQFQKWVWRIWWNNTPFIICLTFFLWTKWKLKVNSVKKKAFNLKKLHVKPLTEENLLKIINFHSPFVFC